MKIWLAVLLLLVLASASFAGQPSYTLDAVTGYYGGDSGSEFYPDPVIQGSVTWVNGRSYWGIWGSVPLFGKIDGNSGTEVDLYAGRNFKLGKVVADAGLTTYHCSKLWRVHDDYWAPYINLDYGAGKINYRLHVEYDGTFRPDAAGGALVHLSASRKLNAKDRISLHVLGHSEAFGVEEEWPSAAYIRFDHQVGKVTYFARYQKAFRKDGLAKDNVLVGGVKYAF